MEDLVSRHINGVEFVKVHDKIYRAKLELKCENRSDTEPSFLELDIKFVNKKNSLNLYDNRDFFQFSIVRMT